MQSSLLPEEDLPDPVALATAAARRGTPGHFDELHARGPDSPPMPGSPGLAPEWARFFGELGPGGWSDLEARQAHVRHRIREDGVTYNVYADGPDSARAWPLELLPFIVPAAEWAGIERGVQQRARLLNGTMADIHGPRRLLREGLLPPSLVLAHPQYLRPAHGIVPPGGVHLHVAAFDLARGPEGQWWVLAQRLSAPSGLGYLLENRLIVASQFPEAFAAMRVQRVAGAFKTLIDGLMRLSPAGERARVALLTPGPHNETYFEHVFLARYLGLTLVEGSDLAVRNDRVYLKTLHGLQQVHVILRRVDDEWLDPLELRPDSALGVPGLLQALRAGHVVVANTPGTGVLESPGLAAFWPAVSRALLGEELLLPASTHWWCGEAPVWRAQREALGDYVIAPTFPPRPQTAAAEMLGEPLLGARLDDAGRRALARRIDDAPAAYTLQARVRPSETPVWTEGRLEPRPAVLRVFALSDGQGGWTVLPGGLTRVASRRIGASDPWLSMQRGSASADTWVIADGEVDTTTLLARPLSADDLLQRRPSVTSRAAENLFWFGRYTERAENSARIARLTLEQLPTARAATLGLIDTLARQHGLVGAAVPSPQQSLRVYERAVIQALGDPEGATSVGYNLRALRQSAQALRERLSTEHWKLVQEADDHFRQHMAAAGAPGEKTAAVNDVVGVLARAAIHLAAITGAQTDRMTRDDGWRLLSVGRQIERLDMLSRTLADGIEARVHETDEGFTLLLALFDSVITYRAQFQARRELPPLLHLLVLDTDNPRSLAWVARTLRDRLRKLARDEAAWADTALTALPRPDDWSLAALCRPDDDGGHPALVDKLRALADGARAVSEEIGRKLFVHVAPTSSALW